MNKISSDDFAYAQSVFQAILDKQPELLKVKVSPTEGSGAQLAEMVFGFVERYEELRKQKVER